MKGILKSGYLVALGMFMAVFGVRAVVIQGIFSNAVANISTNALATNGVNYVGTIQAGGTIERMVVNTSPGITNCTLLLKNMDDSSTALITNLFPGATGSNTLTTFTLNYTNAQNLLHGTLEILASNVLAVPFNSSNGTYLATGGITSSPPNIAVNVLEIR